MHIRVGALEEMRLHFVLDWMSSKYEDNCSENQFFLYPSSRRQTYFRVLKRRNDYCTLIFHKRYETEYHIFVLLENMNVILKNTAVIRFTKLQNGDHIVPILAYFKHFGVFLFCYFP